MTEADEGGLTGWIERLFDHPELLSMGHNQRRDDLNLGLGWIYYGLGRVTRPTRAVVIGSYRGFVPLVLAKAFHDNVEPGEVVFIDPSLVDDFWVEPDKVEAWFRGFGVDNVRHFAMTTQEFVATDGYRALEPLGLLFVDGYHSAEQARFDFESFAPLLAPGAAALFHDSLLERRSAIYGEERSYDVRVKDFLTELDRDPGWQRLDLPYGTGLTMVRRRVEGGEPHFEGMVGRPPTP